MSTLNHVTIEAADPAATDSFHEALGVSDWVRTSQASGPLPEGFRGFTLSVVVGQPAGADVFVETATSAGATIVKPATKSLFGYGGTLRAPDGTIWTVASASKKNSGPPDPTIESTVLQLGVEDVAVSKAFYTDHGLTVAKSFGRKYVEFDTGPVTLTLTKRPGLAKVVGVPGDGSGVQGIVLPAQTEAFTDPDGLRWA